MRVMDANWKLEIGLKVRAAREARGMTQEQLAEAINQATRTISYLETGKKMPTLTTLLQVASALRRSLEAFLPSTSGEEADPVIVQAEARLSEILRNLSTKDIDLVVGHADLVLRTRGREGQR